MFVHFFSKRKCTYVCTNEWHLLPLRREDEMLFFTLPSSLIFLNTDQVLMQNMVSKLSFLVTFFFFLLKLVYEAQEKQVEILSACKCKSVARAEWKATTWSHCGNCIVELEWKSKWLLSIIKKHSFCFDIEGTCCYTESGPRTHVKSIEWTPPSPLVC
jgi:hypothetical protein